MRRSWVGIWIYIAVILTASPCVAQEWPTRAVVKIVVGFPAGTSTDIIARVYADKLKEHFKRPFIVENVPGTSSERAAAMVATGPADGYSLFVGTIANAIGQSVFKNVGFDLRKDFAPISLLASSPTVLAVSPKIPVKTVKDVVEYAKARPGQVFFASGGVGTAPQLVGELFNEKAGTKLVHVPYKSIGEAIADLLTGRVPLMFAPLPAIASYLKSGQLRAIAITSAKRSPLMPETPTFAELGFEHFNAEIWYGLLAPKNTPAAIVNALADVLHRATNDPDAKQKLAAIGAEPISSSPKEFSSFIRAEVAKWSAVVRTAGIKIE